MRLYIIRHADPDYERNSLTPIGHVEAQALAERFASVGIDHIYSSHAGRAKDTARYTAEKLGLPVHVEEWLHEPQDLFVEQDGQSYAIWDTHGLTIRNGQPLPTHEDWCSRPPFDQPHMRTTYEAFARASDDFLARHGYRREGGRYRIVRRNQEKIAAFCHNGTVMLFLSHLLAIPYPLVCCGFFAWPSSVTTILFDERSVDYATPRALGVADLSHLYKSGLTPQPRGVITNQW